MIYIIHKNNHILEILNNEFQPMDYVPAKSTVEVLFNVTMNFPEELIIWCHEDLRYAINKDALKDIFHHNGIMASYSVSEYNFIPDSIGYVDQSIFIKVNKEVTYPTWLMSSDIGGIHASVLNSLKKTINKDYSFDYFLNSLGKLTMPGGLFCYSEPRLLRKWQGNLERNKASDYQLFKFVKQHYKSSWIFFLMLCFFVYERRFPVFAFLNSFRFRKRNIVFDLNQIGIQSSKSLITKREVDVIIPTLGRKKYLYNVLKDLSVQTVLPKNVIIIEQNADPTAISELDYILNEAWPFNIKHKFIHQTGVCNARNLAIDQVTSEWTLLGDDDNRFKPDLINNLLDRVNSLGNNVITTVYIQPNEKQTFFKTSQTQIFGGGNSFLNSKLLEKVKFDSAYEFGYGEDNDFGMQIRNLGEDVIFISDILITHLKAPIGGYRTKHKNKWDDKKYRPKPSPTIMLFNQKYFTKKQILGYKLLLFIKFYKDQSIKNPFRYISYMNRRWNSSISWSNYLSDNKNA